MTSSATTLTPTSIADVQDLVLFAVPGGIAGIDATEEGEPQPIASDFGPPAALRPSGGRTKPGLSAPGPGHVQLDLSQLTGVLDYQPDECTFTALAGTPVEAIEALLAEHGQCLPFEAPFAARGATLGGTVAAGLNGPGRARYGGVRDFLIGARFVDGEGRLVRGGGRVVKNAAGFNLHHLLLGSLGRLGVLVEVTFKVFPLPKGRATLRVRCPSLADALNRLAELRRSAFELDAVELDSDGTLHLRLGGSPSALRSRVDALAQFFAGAAVDEVDDTAAGTFWVEARELAGEEGTTLVRVATTLGSLRGLDARLDATGARRRYSACGEAAWVWGGGPVADLDRMLAELALPGVQVRGGDGLDPFLGRRPDRPFLERVSHTLDPRGTFGGFPSSRRQFESGAFSFAMDREKAPDPNF
jgi:glycolate oxidase FAD binding subunit